MSEKRPAHVTLVRPPVILLQSSLSSYGAIPPIGLAYVAATLRRAGHSIQVIDAAGEAIDKFRDFESPVGALTLNGLTPEEIVERIHPQAQYLGITHMFLHEWPTILEIATRAKKRFPDMRIILGGENATAFHSWVFKQTDVIDFCVLGEGESTSLELIERLQNGVSLAGLSGVACREEGRGTGPVLPQRITQLDSLPRPAWDLFPIENYLAHSDKHGVHRGRSMPILSTRGCPYRCTFCSSPDMWTTRYVTRTPREVVDEIKDYVRTYEINNINFCDLTAIIKKEWTLEFAKLLKRENLGITWQLPTGTRTEVMDAEVLKVLYETGCRNITYAPESGSERMLKAIKKAVKLPRMLESLRAAREVGMVTRVNIIIGHPMEQWGDTFRSLLFLLRAAWVGCQDAAVMIFAPYPGSADFKRLLELGEVEIGKDYYYLALARSGLSSRTYNPRMTTRQLVFVQFGLLIAFYGTAYLSRPWRFLSALRSLITGQENTQLDQLLRSKLRAA